MVKIKNNVFITRTFSKIHGLGSLRVGWGYGPRHVIDAVKRVKGPFNLSAAAQVTATAAIRDTEYVKSCRAENIILREYLSSELKKINILFLPVIKAGPYRKSIFEDSFSKLCLFPIR